MDLVVVSHGPDVKLLRHFLKSYELYYNSKDKLHIFVSRNDTELIHDIELPSNAIVRFREDHHDVAAATAFSQQLFLKLAAYSVVTTEFFCIMDSDFLFIQPTCDEDFFMMGKPVWFYRTWVDGEPPLRWRAGSERFIGASVDYNYADIAQYVFKRSVAADLARKYDLTRVLNDDTISEFLVYAWFAHQNYPEEYFFALEPTVAQPVVRKVNQIPPDYCHLDPSSRYEQYRSSKCVAFWSHWDLAEAKMVEFLEDSQQDHFGEVRRPADRRPLRHTVAPEALVRGDYHDVDGTFADGWVKEEVHLRLAIPPATAAVQLGLDVPGNPADADWRLRISASLDGLNQDARVELEPGSRSLLVRVPEQAHEQRCLLRIAFGPGFRDPSNPDQREFRARIRDVRFDASSPPNPMGER